MATEPLADQIVAGIKRQIDDRLLRPGTKLPSIRSFAESYQVSRFTVVEAYDRLVAMGYLQSRRGAGFYTATRPRTPRRRHPVASDNHKRNEELVWLIRRLLEADENTMLAGGPWLPNSWLDEAGIRQSLNVLARKNGAHLLEYGDPFGYLPLREHLALMLGGLGITARRGPDPADAGRPVRRLSLSFATCSSPATRRWLTIPATTTCSAICVCTACEMLAVPRNRRRTGRRRLEKLAAAHKPKVYFTQSVMQNPTGSDMSPMWPSRCCRPPSATASLVVEDDIFCDLQAKKTPRLATLDQLKSVIYVRSFSKTLSGSLRVGFVACAQRHRQRARRHQDADQHHQLAVHRTADLSDPGGRTLPQVSVTIARAAWRGARQRRARLRTHRARDCLSSPRTACSYGRGSRMSRTRWPWRKRSQRDGIMLAPGAVFRPHLERSPWMRFNVSACEDRRVLQWLQRQAMSKPA